MEATKFVLLGHVDHGKSTLSGRILYNSGYIDDREADKLKKEADTNKMSSWWLSYILDINEEERLKGKTHGYVNIPFNFNNNSLELIDVPGHKQLVSEMVQGANIADIGVLVVSIRKGEYEQGIEGQTLEHLMIARGIGITSLVVAINKMDTIDWNYDEYTMLVTKITKKIKKLYFKHIIFVPISAYNGDNVSERIKKEEFRELPTLIESILSIPKEKKEKIYFDVNEKKCIFTKLIFFNVTNIISKGATYILHSDNKTAEATIVFIKNGNSKYVSANNIKNEQTKKPNNIYTIFQFNDNIDKVTSNLVIRSGDKTIGFAQVIQPEKFKKLISK